MKRTAFSLLLAATGLACVPPGYCGLIAPEGVYIKMSPGMFQPTEQQVFAVKSLTDKQKQALKEVFQKHAEEVSSLTKKIDAAGSEFDTGLNKILTPKQFSDLQSRLASDPIMSHIGSSRLAKQMFVRGDVWGLKDLTKDQRMQVDVLYKKNQPELASLEKRLYAIRGEQGQAVEKLLTIPQLAEIQHKANKEEMEKRNLSHR